MEQRDFFISYNDSDKEWAEWVDEILARNGLTTYMRGKIPGVNVSEMSGTEINFHIPYHDIKCGNG